MGGGISVSRESRHVYLALGGFAIVLLSVFTAGCGLVKSLAGGSKPASLSLDTKPATVQGGVPTQFSASISHNNGQFLGANWTITSHGSPCSTANPSCGTLNGYTNSGSSGQGDSTTIMYTAPCSYGNSVVITATSIENTSSSDSDTFTVTAGQFTITTPQLPAGTVGSAYSASAQAVCGAAPYTWSTDVPLPIGLSINASTGTISGTPQLAGTYNFNLIATDSSQAQSAQAESVTIGSTGGVSASCAGTPSGHESLLKGQYAFLLEGLDSAGSPDAITGTLTADGAGKITAGEEDYNFNTGNAASNQSVTAGSYKVGADNRGCIAITTSAGSALYSFALGSINSGVAGGGRVVEVDGTAFSTGVMKRQDSTAFNTTAINGNYAFGMASPTPGQFVIAGSFTAGGGAISSGALDYNQGGNTDGAGQTYPTNPVAFTGTAAVDANGRATLSFILPGALPAAQVDATCYVISATDLYCIDADAQTSGYFFAGEILQQSGAFSQASLNGTSVRYLSGLDSTGTAAKVEIGLVQADGIGSFTFAADTNDGGVVSSPSATGTYSIASNGRMTVTGGLAPIFYLVAQNEAFAVSTSSNVTSGFLEPQSAGPFSNGSIQATYSFGLFIPSAASAQFGAGEMSLDGSGNASITEDITGGPSFGGGVSTGQTSTGTYAISNNGRGTLTLNQTGGGTVDEVFYIISPTKWVRIPTTSSSGAINYPSLLLSVE